jgi:hypothetical protein
MPRVSKRVPKKARSMPFKKATVAHPQPPLDPTAYFSEETLKRLADHLVPRPFYQDPDRVPERAAGLIASGIGRVGESAGPATGRGGWNLLEQYLEGLDSIIRDIQRKVNDQVAPAYGPEDPSPVSATVHSPRLDEANMRLRAMIDRASVV